jgi:hypothetical protein
MLAAFVAAGALTTTGVAALASTGSAATTAPSSFANRGDIKFLPAPLKAREVQLAQRLATFLPMTAFNEAAGPSQLFQYYLIDQKHFQPNVFSSAASSSQPTIGAVRVVLEPKPGLPTNPNNVRAAIDTFTDVVGLPVINNEAGFYESWLIHDLTVPAVKAPRTDGHAQFGAITPADAAALKHIGAGNNVPGHILTLDGNTPRFGSTTDRFPNPARQPNTVPLFLTAGTFNGTQQADAHNYWEFNTGTDWSIPLYELPFTGGIPGTYAAGKQYSVQSLIPGPGPAGMPNNKVLFGDNPNNPRNPDNSLSGTPPAEARLRGIPTGLANEVLLDVYARPVSFEPSVHGFQRLFDAYKLEVARVDQNHDGVIGFAEADVTKTSDGLPNTRLYLPATAFNRWAITQQLNDGMLAPRFAPSQRAFVLSGFLTNVNPPVPASIPPGSGG